MSSLSATSSAAAARAASAKETCKIFVGGLNSVTSEDKLREHFELFGELIECTIMRDASGHSRCFGFVTFADPATVDLVIRQVHILDAKQIDPKPAVPRALHDPSFSREDQNTSVSLSEAKIFVGGIHPSVTEEELVTAFSTFGNVVDVRIMQDKDTQRSKGFGFVMFSTRVEARKAANAGFLEIKGKKAEIKLALPKTPSTINLGKRSSSPKDDAVQGAMLMYLNNGIYDPAVLMAAIAYVNQHYHHLTALPPPLQPSSVHPIVSPPISPAPFMPFPMMPPPAFGPETPHFIPPFHPFPFNNTSKSSSLQNSRSSSMKDLKKFSHPPNDKSKNNTKSDESDPDWALIYGEESESKDTKRIKTVQ